MNKSNKDRARQSLKTTIIVVAVVCLFLILVTTASMVWWPDNDIFSTAVSNNYQMNIPFTIFIEVLATSGGIILGLQIDNYVDERRGQNNYKELILRITKFIDYLVDGTNDKASNTVYDLAQYKMHWDLLLQADAFSVQALQNSKYYFDLAYVFNFLHANERYWTAHQDKTINDLKKERYTVGDEFIKSLNNWIEKAKNLQKNLQAIIHIENNNVDWGATSKKLTDLRENNLKLREKVCQNLDIKKKKGCQEACCKTCSKSSSCALVQDALSKLFKVSKKTIKKWEENKSKPTLDQLMYYSELCQLEIFDVVILNQNHNEN